MPPRPAAAGRCDVPGGRAVPPTRPRPRRRACPRPPPATPPSPPAPGPRPLLRSRSLSSLSSRPGIRVAPAHAVLVTFVGEGPDQPHLPTEVDAFLPQRGADHQHFCPEPAAQLRRVAIDPTVHVDLSAGQLRRTARGSGRSRPREGGASRGPAADLEADLHPFSSRISSRRTHRVLEGRWRQAEVVTRALARLDDRGQVP